ncbi:hypothetical protein [Actinophytocola sp.]|uniref:hypothetical protein n=1 Tax=Actinophytocola sp. TaxID=1872138 RepID=UPI002D80C8C3|nr:hypothetical protein [Actinophytocola sp.]HET9138300.1 hypothetical protein [Actinophytocola sp.]
MAEGTNTGLRWAVIVIAVVAIVLLIAFAKGRAQRGEQQPHAIGGLAVAAQHSQFHV